ncbi:MAG: dihydrodipicolinate reductase, partial [Candidatus Nanopelagicales bacterium]
MANSAQYRVVFWGIGAIGTELLTAILDHRRDLTIAGARVYSPEKNGVDIAELIGRSPIGVTATTDVDEILALDADCVLYTPRNTSIDDVC